MLHAQQHVGGVLSVEPTPARSKLLRSHAVLPPRAIDHTHIPTPPQSNALVLLPRVLAGGSGGGGGPGAAVWLGLTDRGNFSIEHDGGGWMWVDGNVSPSP